MALRMAETVDLELRLRREAPIYYREQLEAAREHAARVVAAAPTAPRAELATELHKAWIDVPLGAASLGHARWLVDQMTVAAERPLTAIEDTVAAAGFDRVRAVQMIRELFAWASDGNTPAGSLEPPLIASGGNYAKHGRALDDRERFDRMEEFEARAAPVRQLQMAGWESESAAAIRDEMQAALGAACVQLVAAGNVSARDVAAAARDIVELPVVPYASLDLYLAGPAAHLRLFNECVHLEATRGLRRLEIPYEQTAARETELLPPNSVLGPASARRIEWALDPRAARRIMGPQISGPEISGGGLAI